MELRGPTEEEARLARMQRTVLALPPPLTEEEEEEEREEERVRREVEEMLREEGGAFHSYPQVCAMRTF